MKTEIVEDKVLKTIPVYLSKSLLDKLHVLQYTTHPFTCIKNEQPVIKARVKPENCVIELEVGIRTRPSYFDRSKGEQIALNVDGAGRNQKAKEDNYFEGNVMDKLIFVSSQCMVNINNYAVGVMADGCLHLSPITAMVAMKPSFEYLDTAEKRRKNDSKDQVEDMDVEEATKKVTVRFERPETERSRDYKEKSYAFHQKKIRDEPWINPKYHTYGSQRSKLESRYLYCSYPNESVDQFALNRDQYLRSLIPQDEEEEVDTSGHPADQNSVTASKPLSLEDRLKVIIQNAVAASFNELVFAVANKNKSEDPSSILNAIQDSAILVQGNWVVKSESVYPKDGVSESNVANETLQRTRDYILYQFTKNTIVSRSTISEVIMPIPDQDLTKVFKGIAKCKGKRGIWEFILPTDTNFIKKHPEVVQRQQMIWHARHEQLSQNFLKKK